MSEILTSAVVEVCNGAGSVFTRDLSMFGKEKVTFGSSPANDIFIDSKIPNSERDSYPVVTDSTGEIIWIPGLKKSHLDRKKEQKYDIILRYD